jgi:hypothetical protein
MRVKMGSWKRWGIAVLAAVIIHVLIALLLHPMHAARSTRVRAERILFLRVIHRHERKRPIPHRRRPIHLRRVRLKREHWLVRAHSRAAAGARARDLARRLRAAHGARWLAVRKVLSVPTMRPALPLAAFLGEARVAGVGRIAGGTGAQGAGAGGNAGSGEVGAGAGISGAGSGAGLAPCGSPFIRRRGEIKTYGGLEHVNVSIQLELRNGSRSEEEVLPYPLVYRSDAESPFSDRNRNDPRFATVLLQPPPLDFDRSNLSPLIAEVLAHTTPGGYTSFGPCPSQNGPGGP